MPEQSHASVLAAAEAEIARRSARVAAGAQRLRYHPMAPVGMMGDPNGLIQYGGEFHLFFQFMPTYPEPGGMHWGHFVSDDLVHWRLLPTALGPSEEYDSLHCMSGSAIVDDDGRLVLMYSGAAPGAVPQNVATSDDGVRFVKSPANPVIPSPPPGVRSAFFRDPRLGRFDGVSYVVIGSAGPAEASPAGTGRALLYRSGEDLLDWSYAGVVAETSTLETMWECPDLFPLGDRFVLLVSPISGTIISPPFVEIGPFDIATGTLATERRQVLDEGDVYAPQTLQDSTGRRILFAWMGHRDNSVVTADEGWYGAMTVPRELVLVDGRVRQRPVRELESLRGAPREHGPASIGREGLRIDTGSSAEVRLVLGESAARKCRIGVRASADRSELTSYVLDRNAGRVTCDRSLSGRGPVSGSVAEFDTHAGDLELRFFLDTSSIELFIDDGAGVLTQCVYPDAASTGFFLEPIGEGTLDVVALTVWPLAGI